MAEGLPRRYEFRQALGTGGEGQVFLVADLLRDGELVVLKRLARDDAAEDRGVPGGRGTPRLVEQIRREFRLLAGLRHPSLAPVHDFGLLADNTPYFTRAFVAGSPLAAPPGGLDVPGAVRLLLGVCDALEPLHASGLLHGDIKPANVIVEPSGAVTLIDFSLARPQGAPDGLPSGTVAFMAPERLRGEPLDARADLYAVGVLAWYLLAGRLPFGPGLAETIDGHLRREPPRLSSRAPGTDDIEPVVRRLLAKDPVARYPDVRELRAALLGACRAAAGCAPAPACAALPALTGGIVDVDALAADLLAEPSDDRPLRPALVLGEPGAGKSTVLRELQWRAQLAGWTVLPLAGRAAGGWRDTLAALLRAARLLDDEPPAEPGAVTPAAVPDPTAASDVRLRQAADAVAAAAAPDGALLDEVHRALASWRRTRRVLLVIDDVDRLPETLLPLWRMLVCPGGAGAFRGAFSAAPDARFAEALFGAEDYRAVPLAPLDEEQVGSLVRRALGRDDPDLRAQLLRFTSGNPALVYETLLALVEGRVPFVDELSEAPLADRLRRLWTERLDRLGPDTARVLLALAAAGAPLSAAALAALVPRPEDRAEARRTLVGLGLARRTPGDGLAVERGEPRVTLARAVPDRIAPIAAELLDRVPDLPPAVRLRLAVAAGRDAQARELLAAGADALIEAGAAHEAADLLERLLRRTAGAPESADTLPVLDRLLDALERTGEARRALELTRRALPATGVLPFGLLLRCARLAALAGENEEADDRLAQAAARAEGAAQRSAVAAARARAWMRRGRHAAARDAALAGLADGAAGEDRLELLLVAGMAADLLGDAAAAAPRYAEAAELADRLGSPALRMKVRAHEAFTLQRSGRLDEAAQRYRECLEQARAADDRGAIASHAANLATVLHLAGRIGEAIRSYETALAAARWVGRASTALTTQANLAMCLAIVGQFEQSLRHAEEAAAAAGRLGLRRVEWEARAVVADVARRRGDLAAAREGFAAAEAGFAALGQEREAAEAALHRLECVALAGDPVPSDELARLAARIEAGRFDDFVPRLRAVQARAALAAGDTAAAISAAERSFAAAERRGDLEAQAEAAAILAGILAGRGDTAGAEKHRRARRAALEALAADLPDRLRTSFLAAQRDPCPAGPPAGPATSPPAPAPRTAPDVATRGAPAAATEKTMPAEAWSAEARAAAERPLFRLLEINRELVRESDVGRLFDAIMDAAVRFTGAERGFLLLPADGGGLEVRCVREFSQVELPEEHRRFSRSIAEQVYRDGEPVVTVSAQEDERFGRVLSVHELQLQSILCVPIRGRERTLGVLYLENRVRRGLFHEADRDLLLAFGDQVALAIENARLIEALRHRTRELEEAQARLQERLDERGRELERRTEQLQKVERDLATARRVLEPPHGFPGLVGESPAMRRVYHLVRRVLDTDVPVVLVGESGTGKEVVARAIHEHGLRRKGRFVALNCGAFPEGLIESELFGHVRGAFTGAVRDKKGVLVEAEGGTLLLDEVGDMPAKMQTDLLRALQERKVRPLGSNRDVPIDVRVIAATQLPLRTLVDQGRFREDLFYRLSVVEIPIPALRERLDDLPLLVDHFLTVFAARFGTPRKTVSREAIRLLMTLPWPGNVRQLEHAILNAWVLAEGDVLTPDDFGSVMAGGPAAGPPAASGPVASRALFEAAERERMLEALRAARWNKTRAADALGIPRRTFYRKLARYGIDH